mmetsp:Transcript_26076/g.57468  ORF Transcript_26076/g.57468 Transcript_26076/m.57468 type:complete len:295 (-) Transcript_26076:9-893(-)
MVAVGGKFARRRAVSARTARIPDMSETKASLLAMQTTAPAMRAVPMPTTVGPTRPKEATLTPMTGWRSAWCSSTMRLAQSPTDRAEVTASSSGTFLPKASSVAPMAPARPCAASVCMESSCMLCCQALAAVASPWTACAAGSRAAASAAGGRCRCRCHCRCRSCAAKSCADASTAGGAACAAGAAAAAGLGAVLGTVLGAAVDPDVAWTSMPRSWSASSTAGLSSASSASVSATSACAAASHAAPTTSAAGRSHLGACTARLLRTMGQPAGLCSSASREQSARSEAGSRAENNK